jgi:hypothetical protein
MWNPFKKDTNRDKDALKDPTDPKNMGLLSRMAMKQFQKMSPEEQEKVMKKALDPKNIAKNKDKIIEMLDAMEKSGQMDRHQIFQIKKQLGLL